MTNFDYYIKGRRVDEGWNVFTTDYHSKGTGGVLYRYNKWLLEEHEEPILDDAERKYLSNIIKPFRDKVVNITKLDNGVHCRISVRLYDNNGVDHLFLPKFDCSAKMYINMRPNRRYTLKELNL
jgi:hypothetical protein